MSRGKDQDEGRSPAEKRRKTNVEMGEGLDDSWEEYSQADYEFIDTIASQVITRPACDLDSSQHAPGLIQSSQSDTLPIAPQFVAPLQPAASFQKSRSSSSSQNGLASDTSSSSVYPKSIGSSRGSLSVTSISSSSSSSGGRNVMVPQAAKRESLDRGTSLLLPTSPHPDIGALQAEIEQLRAVLRSTKEEECGKDGEIRMLRESLKRAQEDRLEHIQNIHTQKSEKEKSLRVENERLSTQLQFREREYQELQERCRHMEQRIQHVGVGPSGDHSPVTSSPISRKPGPSQKSPKTKPALPSTSTFLASEKGQLSSGWKSDLKDAETMTSTTEEIITSRRRGTLSLNVRHSEGKVSGPQLVSKLIRSDRRLAKDSSDESIIGLLQAPSTSLDLRSFMFERDSSTLLLSPVRSRRLSDVKMSLQNAERSESKQIVPSSLHTMAVNGLQHLLALLSVNSPVTQRRQSTHPATTDTPSPSNQSGPLLILPLLNCYLSRYVDLLNNSTTDNAVMSPSSSTGSLRTYSSESPSSLESLTSSLSLLLMDGQRFANSLENYCCASLTTLCKLVSFSSAVRQFLLTGMCGLSRQNQPKATSSREAKNKSQSVPMETDIGSVSSADSSMLSSSSTSADQLEDIHLLDIVLRLANPGHGQEACTCNPHVVEGALNVISALASPLPEPHCERLKAVISQGVVVNCIECDSLPSIVLAGLKLLCQLCHSPVIMSSLCTRADNCPLLSMYLLSIKSFENTEAVIKIYIYKQVIVCICNITSSHGGGLGILLDTDCHCSVEIVRSVVTMLCYVLDQYQHSSCNDDLSLLCRGLILLHRMSQHDGQFTDKHQEVQHLYVHLVCGLTALLRHNSKLYDNELSSLADLWDFPQDDYELSQDSEEDGIETDTAS